MTASKKVFSFRGFAKGSFPWPPPLNPQGTQPQASVAARATLRPCP